MSPRPTAAIMSHVRIMLSSRGSRMTRTNDGHFNFPLGALSVLWIAVLPVLGFTSAGKTVLKPPRAPAEPIAIPGRVASKNSGSSRRRYAGRLIRRAPLRFAGRGSTMCFQVSRARGRFPPAFAIGLGFRSGLGCPRPLYAARFPPSAPFLRWSPPHLQCPRRVTL